MGPGPFVENRFVDGLFVDVALRRIRRFVFRV